MQASLHCNQHITSYIIMPMKLTFFICHVQRLIIRVFLQNISFVTIVVLLNNTQTYTRITMSTLLQRLHWLPVEKRIEFKILVLVYKAIYERQPVYLASLLNQHTPLRCLWYSSGILLDLSRINLERFGRRAFACAGRERFGPTLWNNLPTNIRVNDNHTQFKKLLKSYLCST